MLPSTSQKGAAGSVHVPVEHFAAGFSFVLQLAANNAPDNNIHLHMLRL
jgi:hypothetical protein